jgi:hypothetical protein
MTTTTVADATDAERAVADRVAEIIDETLKLMLPAAR